MSTCSASKGLWVLSEMCGAFTMCGTVAGNWEGCYELSVGNADKGMLPIEEVRRRVEPFVSENLPLVLTQVTVEFNGSHLYVS